MNYEEHKRDHREKLKLMSNKAWAKNQSNDTTRKNLPNHCREVDAPLQCVGMEIDSLERGDGGVVVFNDLRPREAWCQRCGTNRCGKSVWPYLDLWDSVCLRTISTLECSEEVWAAWRGTVTLLQNAENR